MSLLESTMSQADGFAASTYTKSFETHEQTSFLHWYPALYQSNALSVACGCGRIRRQFHEVDEVRSLGLYAAC